MTGTEGTVPGDPAGAGRPLASSFDSSDASRRHRREAETLEARFKGLLDAAPDAMVIVNAEGRIVLANLQTQRLFGYTRDEILGEPVEMLVPRDFHPQHPALRDAYFADPRPRPMGAGVDLSARRKDGSEFPAEISVSPMKGDDGRVLVTASVRNVTDRKLLEQHRAEEREEQSRRIQEANRLKSEFLANMSHELRTPLNAIIGFADLMGRGMTGPLNGDQTQCVSDILTSGRHLLQLINDVLDLAKVESGKMEFRPEAVDVGRVTREVRDLLRTLAAQKHIRLEIEEPTTLSDVFLDAAKLKQVLYNFLSNALKFTPDGGHVRIRVRAEGEDRFRLEVEDTGIGIDTADLTRLFVEFQQLDPTTIKKHQGTGLGLALTRRLVEAQGGAVGVTSTLGVGSVFWAVIPRRPRTEPVLPALAVNRAPPAFTGAPAVLVIEDDPRERAWLSATLAAAHYDVVSVGNGAEAIARAKEQRFDAVTLDLLLPDMNGWDVLRAIRADGPNKDIPTIVVTVVSEKSTAIGFAIHDFLSKPVRAADLLDSLNRAGVRPHVDRTILVVDDDPMALRLAQLALSENGYHAVCEVSPARALERTLASPPAAIVLDLMMPEMDGFEFLRRLRSMPVGRQIPVVVWTLMDLTADLRARLQANAQAVVEKGDGSGECLLAELRAFIRPTIPSKGGR